MDVRLSNKEDSNGLIKGMDKVYEKFYERRMTILGLWKIRTEKINAYKDRQTILKQKYIEFAMNYVKETCNIDYQSCIFVCYFAFLTPKWNPFYHELRGSICRAN